MSFPADRYARAGATPEEIAQAQRDHDKLPEGAKQSFISHIESIADADLRALIEDARKLAAEAETEGEKLLDEAEGEVKKLAGEAKADVENLLGVVNPPASSDSPSTDEAPEPEPAALSANYGAVAPPASDEAKAALAAALEKGISQGKP